MPDPCQHPLGWYLLNTGEMYGYANVCAMCGELRDPDTNQLLEPGNPQRVAQVSSDRTAQIRELTDQFLDALSQWMRKPGDGTRSRLDRAAKQLALYDPGFKFALPASVAK